MSQLRIGNKTPKIGNKPNNCSSCCLSKLLTFIILLKFSVYSHILSSFYKLLSLTLNYVNLLKGFWYKHQKITTLFVLQWIQEIFISISRKHLSYLINFNGFWNQLHVIITVFGQPTFNWHLNEWMPKLRAGATSSCTSLNKEEGKFYALGLNCKIFIFSCYSSLSSFKKIHWF